MSILTKFGSPLLFTAALIAAPPALADFYIGGSAGWSDFSDGNAASEINVGAVDGSDAGFKVFGGYQLNQYLGFELTYVNLGKAAYSGTFQGATVTGGTLDTTGLNASVVGTLPINPSFGLFGKVGLFKWETDVQDVRNGAPFKAKRDGNDGSYGIGASYNLNPKLALRAEWERYKAADDIDLLSVGVAFKF
jgi:OOP family OmpA-OmpF porin